MIEYRSMTPADIAGGLRLCRSAGWNQLERDWQMFLSSGPGACAVATEGEKIVGTAATIRYGQSFSWIGMVLVDPMNRRQGIGLRLLDEALKILQDEETVKLDATPEGRTVYQQLNFVDEYHLSRMVRPAGLTKLKSSTARPIEKSEMQALLKFDRNIFGANRSALLQWMWEGAPSLAFIEESQGQIVGYCFARKGFQFTHIGPVIAENISIAKNLVTASLQNCNGQPVLLDAMHFEPEWLEWLGSVGFMEQRTFTRMYRGANNFPGMPEKQFAILGPEFG